MRLHVYESYYGFERPPFRVVADPKMLFASRSAREALGCLEFCVRTGKGIAVMTGEVGTGKTTLVNRFLDAAGPELQTAYIFNPTLTRLQMVRTLAEELGIQPVPRSKVDLARKISETLLQSREAGRRTVLFVDEAHVLKHEALEELRLISNLETWEEKLLHIVLVGQPELLTTLESFELRPLRQRVELFIRITPMDAEETHQYVEHRLRAARPLREVRFSDAAVARIHTISCGNPRDINKICDAALLVAYVEEAPVVNAEHVDEALATINPQRVGLRPVSNGRRRVLPRLGMAAASIAAVAALAFTYDSDRTRRNGVPVLDAMSHVATPTARASGGAVDAAPPALFVRLASFSEAQAAREFARSLRVMQQRSVYVHNANGEGTRSSYDVLLGGFDDAAEAASFASGVHTAGNYAGAQVVRVGVQQVEEYERP